VQAATDVPVAAAAQNPASVPVDLAAELGALEPPPEEPLAMDFIEKEPAGPAPLPPANEQSNALSGLDAFASLGEQELESG
jgi:hypothetical protein